MEIINLILNRVRSLSIVSLLTVIVVMTIAVIISVIGNPGTLYAFLIYSSLFFFVATLMWWIWFLFILRRIITVWIETEHTAIKIKNEITEIRSLVELNQQEITHQLKMHNYQKFTRSDK